MNEQIKKLFQETFSKGYPVVRWEDDEKFHEEFAKAIIQECLEVLNGMYLNIPEEADLDETQTWVKATMNSTINLCSGKIQRHFGINHE